MFHAFLHGDSLTNKATSLITTTSLSVERTILDSLSVEFFQKSESYSQLVTAREILS